MTHLVLARKAWGFPEGVEEINKQIECNKEEIKELEKELED